MMTIEEFSQICRALSDTNRILIIDMLTTGEKCGCELLQKLHITQPTLSHHMKILEDCELVSAHKEGKWHYYSINCVRFKQYKEYINSISCNDISTYTNQTSHCCDK